MSPSEAKELIRELELTGVRFAELMGANKNYVTNFTRDGVPQNVAIILLLCKRLIAEGVQKEEILNIVSSQRNTEYRLITSNPNKIAEFKAMLGDKLIIVQGADLKEVKGTMDEVIIHKAIDAGRGFIVEDTILEVDGQEIVDIKYHIENFKEKSVDAKWIVSLGYNNGKEVFIYRGFTDGKIVPIKNLPSDSFGFDSYFVPRNSSLSLYELAKFGIKDDYSARKKALENFVSKKTEKRVKISEIQTWTKEYQS
jgi:inosine/xanthosine triphosphate pyrophosphatase family protein